MTTTLVHMLPVFAQPNLRNTRGADSELDSEGADGAWSRSDFAHEGWCQFGLGQAITLSNFLGMKSCKTAFTACATSLACHVAKVICCIPNPQMARVATGAVVTGVADEQPRGDRPIRQFIRDAMSLSHTRPCIPMAEHPVTIGSNRTLPRPAFVLSPYRHFSPKTLREYLKGVLSFVFGIPICPETLVMSRTKPLGVERPHTAVDRASFHWEIIP